jgi:hypothetical protein
MLVVGALLIAGCGATGPTDHQQIATIIKQEGAKPITLCDHLTDSLLAQLGGMSGCLRQATSAAPDSSTHAASIRVHGNSATAVEVDQNGSHNLSLIKRRGVWKVSAVS